MKTVKSILLIILLFFICNSSYSQSTLCPSVKDSLFLITIDIRSANKYPVIMSCVSKNNILSSLNKLSIDSLIESFYQKAYFTPDIPNGMRTTIVACLGDSIGHRYLKEHQLDFAKLRSSIDKNSIKTKFQLESGETVNCSVVRTFGTFWIKSKDDKDVSTTSLEIPIKDIKNISTCYIPFELNIIRKEKRKRK